MNQSHPNTLRHLSNTFRHPQIYQCWHCEGHCQEFPTAQTKLGKAVVGYDLFSFCYSINTVLATSRINQTPSRNPPDTPRHNAITSVFSLSVASTRLFGTQSNLFGCFLGGTSNTTLRILSVRGVPPSLYGQNFLKKKGYGYGGYPPPPFTDKIRKAVFDHLPKPGG